MHMADALLSPAVAGTMYAATAAVCAYSVHNIKKDNDQKKLPVMAVSAALVFAGQMVNYTIPGTGASGHLCGGLMLAALLGPAAGFLSMAVILLIQCLLFADGGLLALGANIWNMAFYGCFFGYYLIWRPITGAAAGKGKSSARIRITAASIIGCILSLQLGSLSVVTETSLSGITELPFLAFAGIMQPIHLAIGLVEGLITAAVLCFVCEARPEMLSGFRKESPAPKRSAAPAIAVLAAAAIITGGGLSLLASKNPDGLEWSLFGNKEAGYTENMGLDEEDYGSSSGAADKASQIQDGTAVLPDYSLPGSDSPAGTSAAGIIGSCAVAAAAAGVYAVISITRKKHEQA